MRTLIAALILALIGIVGCCAGENDQQCSACEYDNTPYDMQIQQVSQEYLKDVKKPITDKFAKTSQAYWAWDCFMTCLSMKAPTSKRGKIVDALSNGCISKGCGICKSSGITNWPACITCVGCASTKVGYNIGYAAICAQECLKNRK